MLPGWGAVEVMLHVTLLLPNPPTVVVYCSVPPAGMVAPWGVTLPNPNPGLTVIPAEANRLESAMLVAITEIRI